MLRFRGESNGPGRAGSFTNRSTDNSDAALIAFNLGSGAAVVGVASGTGRAAEFFGDVFVSGTITEQGSGFTIDHPLDSRTKKLTHSNISSPDMMNVYNGNITTDSEGMAKVDLPEYFEALNKDFRYQLTVIGTFAQAIIAKKVQGNSFYIRTNEPSIEVSWQITGVRKDSFAQYNRKGVVEVKEDEMMGQLLFDPLNTKSYQGRYGKADQIVVEN